jgi:hypothetical protein
LYEWVQEEKWMPDEHYRSPVSGLKSLVYEDVQLDHDFTKYSLAREEKTLLDEGLNKFAADWKKLISP